MGDRARGLSQGTGGRLRQPLAAAPARPALRQSERYRRRSVSLAPKARNITKEHQDLATAVLDRNAEKAAELLAAHLAVTTDILLAAEASDLPVPKTKVRA